MANENDTILIQTLIDSYRRQLHYYCGLRDLTRQIMSKLVLSRGEMSSLSDGIQKKREMIEVIEDERAQIAGAVDEWQSRKASVAITPATEALNTVLQQVTDAIQEFLNDEAQLQKYLEGIISRAVPP